MSGSENPTREYVERSNDYRASGGEWVGVRAVTRCMEPNVLRRYADHGARAIRQAAASNIYTPADVLDAFAHDADPLVREQVARNRAALPETLRWLAEDESIEVLHALNLNSRAPRDVLEVAQVATSGDDMVRIASAAEYTLRCGAKDDPLDNPEAAAKAAAGKRMLTNADLPTPWAGQGGYRTAMIDRLIAVARNPQTPPALRAHLVSLPEPEIREAAAE